MEINPKDIKNVFFRMPPAGWLGWRSENDYIYEYVEYLRHRYGIVLPEHTILATHGNICMMRKDCRFMYTTGDVGSFIWYINTHGAGFCGIKIMELANIISAYNEEWGTTKC